MTGEEAQEKKTEFKVDGRELVARLKALVHEGNVRHIVVRNDKGKTILELPVTLGAVGALMAPPYAMIGVLAALLGKCSIVVTRNATHAGTGEDDDQKV